MIYKPLKNIAMKDEKNHLTKGPESNDEITCALNRGKNILSELQKRQSNFEFCDISEDEYQEFKETIKEWVQSVRNINGLKVAPNESVLDPYELDSVQSHSSITLKGKVERVMGVLGESQQ